MTDAFTQAWNLLKALPEQQMFVERTPRENVADDYELNYDDRPEIDRYGARSLGTVHPAILGMLQRRTDDYYQQYGMSPNLNLDLGRDADFRIEDGRKEHARIFGKPPTPAEEHYEAGMSIAQGPDFNRVMYNKRFQPGGTNLYSDDVSHNPDRAARGSPFGHQGRFDYSAQGHRTSHPTKEELRG